MRRRVEGDGCQTNIWLVTEWLTSGHMQSSNHVYGHQKAVDDDWLICKAVWHLYLKHTPEHVPLSLSNLLRLLPCVLSHNIQNHVCLVFYYTFCTAAQIGERFDSISASFWGYKLEIHQSSLLLNPRAVISSVSSVEDLYLCECPGDPNCLHPWCPLHVHWKTGGREKEVRETHKEHDIS